MSAEGGATLYHVVCITQIPLLNASDCSGKLSGLLACSLRLIRCPCLSTATVVVGSVEKQHHCQFGNGLSACKLLVSQNASNYVVVYVYAHAVHICLSCLCTCLCCFMCPIGLFLLWRAFSHGHALEPTSGSYYNPPIRQGPILHIPSKAQGP